MAIKAIDYLILIFENASRVAVVISARKQCFIFVLVTLVSVLFFKTLTEIENGPKTIHDMKLINAGKILENNKTLAESRSPVSETPGFVIVMHVVIRPPMADKNSGNFIHLISSCVLFRVKSNAFHMPNRSAFRKTSNYFMYVVFFLEYNVSLF